jgi:hypothetical protein
MKRIFYCILFFGNILFIFSEDIEQKNDTNELKYIFSLDSDYTMTALKNYGFGIGINYEHKLTDFLSIKPGFGLMVCFSDITVKIFDLQLFINYYPFSDGLDKVYIGLGSRCDFFIYSKKYDIPKDAAISIIPILGWKWKVFKYLMIDPFIGWKFYITKTNNYEKINTNLDGGFQWGINFKIFLPNKK